MRPLDYKFCILLTVFASVLAILNIISAKQCDLPFWPVPVGAGILCYWLTFPITDVVSEVYGKARAQFLVWMGFLTNAIILALSFTSVHLPADEIYENQEAFATVLGAVPIIIFASLTAYLVAQTHDVWAYHFWKRRTGGRRMWLRNNLSTISSQFLDSFVFNGIAFFIFGNWTFADYVMITLGYWLLKLLIAVLDTPLVYLVHFWLTGRWSPTHKAQTAADADPAPATNAP